MKKYISLALAVLMLSLTLCACDDEAAKDTENNELFEKYGALIDAIEDENYEEALGELNGFFAEKDEDGEDEGDETDGEDVETETDTDTDGEDSGPSGDDEKGEVTEEDKPIDTVPPETEFVPETEPMETEPMETEPVETEPEDTVPPEEETDTVSMAEDIAIGHWVYPQTLDGSFKHVYIYEDYCEVFGETYSWEVSDAEAYRFYVYIYNDLGNAYRLSFNYNDVLDFWYNEIYVYDNVYKYYFAIKSCERAVDHDELTVIDLTRDNFFDYFDYVERKEGSYNISGDAEAVTVTQEFILKPEIARNLYTDLSGCDIEITYDRHEYFVEFDRDTLEIDIIETYFEVNGYSAAYSMQYDYNDVSHGYYFELAGALITDALDQILLVCDNIEVVNVTGTLAFFNK